MGSVGMEQAEELAALFLDVLAVLPDLNRYLLDGSSCGSSRSPTIR
jgi:hypothetical protein